MSMALDGPLDAARRTPEWSSLKGVEIVVPGSIGNVGPGFDALSLAVQLFLRIRIVDVIDDSRGRLACEFVDCTLTGPNRLERAFTCARARHAAALPSLSIQVRSEIPLRAGLGSSAAAVIGGLQLFELLTGPKPVSDVLRIATDIEGHPDNAASALCGGLTGCCEYEDGTIAAWSWPWPDAIKLIVATPAVHLETSVARNALPTHFSRTDAVFNLQHTLLLVHALQSGDRQILREALRDRWHQPYRRALVPGLDRMLAIDDPDVLGVCLSGSGPSIVVLADRDLPRVAALVHSTYENDVGSACTIRTLSAYHKGVR